MSSLLGSHQAVALATAMAVSGTLILFAIRRQKLVSGDSKLFLDQNSVISPYNLRSCITTDKGKSDKKKKKVHFAEDVVEPTGDNVEFRRKHTLALELRASLPEKLPVKVESLTRVAMRREIGRMPANRVALYNGILKDRLQRTARAY